MRRLRAWVLRFGGSFTRRRHEREMADEFESHLQMHIEDNVREGMTPEEASRQALIKLGGMDQAKEIYRDRRRLPMLETFLQDVRYGTRMLRKNPGFTAVAILTLALGIGPNTAIFSVLNAVLLRPLPYRAPENLVLVKEKLPKLTPEPVNLPAPDVLQFQHENKSFSALGGFEPQHEELSGSGQPERIIAARVSPDVFPILGINPFLGRTFTSEEDRPGVTVTVISYRLWQRKFAGDRDVLGKTLSLNRKPYTVVGVMPKGFEFPLAAASDLADLWVPMGFTPEEISHMGDNFDYRAIARLKPGVTFAQANEDVAAIAYQILQTYPASMRNDINLGAVTIPLSDAVRGRVQTLLWVLTGAVGFVLLIACANVANLLLARAAGRQREMAVRAALGAGRWRLARQFIIESVMLAVAGGALGLLAAVWGTPLLMKWVPIGLPTVGTAGMDTKVLGFTLALSLVIGILFGAGPAFASSEGDLNQALKESGRSGGLGIRHRHVRSALVVAEAALALILLVGAGLLVRSFTLLSRTDPGFSTQHLLTFSLDLPQAQYQRGEDVLSFFQRVLDRLKVLPGVHSATASSSVPLVNTNWDHIFTPEGYQGGAGDKMPDSWHSVVLGDYFQTLQIPLIRGRFFSDQDRQRSQRVVIISESIAKRYWPRQDPVGQRLKWGPPQGNSPWLTIVGVVGDVKQQGLDERTSFHTYQPYVQLPDVWPISLGRALTVAVRASGAPASLASDVRVSVWSLDRELAISHLETVDQALSQSLASPRFATLLMGAFALLALVLGSVGLYAVISFSVTQRIQEMGIRMALGATSADVLGLVLGQGLKLTLLGVGIGIAGALGLTHFLSSLLYGVKPTDPATYVAVSALLLGVATLASFIPARRATKVDPMVALRHE
jgi:putative ABC transport system permease protein